MQPYYRDNDTTLWCGRWEDVLPRLEPDAADLVIADPPYGVAWQSQRRATLFEPLAGDDGTFDFEGLLRECWRVLRPRRHLYLFGNLSDHVVLAAGFRQVVDLVWDKGMLGAGDVTLPWAPAHECIMFAVRPANKGQAQEREGALAARLRRGSVLRHDRPNAAAVTRHPTEKPVGLMRDMIESSTLIGETVLDPCAGVGSTLVAARMEGRKSIGVELEERYCEAAADRLRQQVLPLAV